MMGQGEFPQSVDGEKVLREWFEKYMAERDNSISKDSPLVQVVDADELDASFVEKQIQESAKEILVTKGFCEKCQKLFDNWPTIGGSASRNHDSLPDQNGGWEHAVATTYTTFELEAGARSGCRFCTFLLQSVKDCELLETFRKIEARIFKLNEHEKSALSVQNWGCNPHQLLWLNLPGKVCTSCNAGIALQTKTDSAYLPASADCYDEPLDVLENAAKWFTNCSQNHERCKSSNDGVLPTRLISIAKEPRLVLTSELVKTPIYATLSHSWGSHEVIKLTSKDLKSFMKALPVDKLPTTFKHAFEITRKLGMDYLWIDSLCILQDSEDDWQRESSLMSSVYGGSAITIAASSARDSTHGCFLKPTIFSGGVRARVTDGGRTRVQDFRNSEEYKRSTVDTHLGTRAWALQEKMLPPRTIHFGDRGAFWECRTSIASEYLPDGFPKNLVSPLVNRKGKFEWLWPQVVGLYSAANLSFGKDKLPALSGVASLGYKETGDQYLAGLWRGQIEEQLCWRRHHSKPIIKRPTWRAPSWSWASIDGGVGWYQPQSKVLETQYAHVLDANTTLYGKDPFGQVAGGTIRLACSSMVAGHLVPNKNVDKPGFDIVLRAGEGQDEFPITIDCLEDGEQEDNGAIHLLPILGGWTGCSSGMADGEKLKEFLVQGVVLRPTGPTKGEFSRIGSFNFYKDSMRWREPKTKIDDSYEPFLKILEEQGIAAAEAACAEIISNTEHPNERYVITLI
ncbi:HET-domain-containing protein [Mollisia scopiformis]|uniref:HET-domain-containing protein n=1 Tax=Mollisia scopiformis TaxID=149040 RepID=A0A194XC30_MOLSC|nr:HET-domain-containing protein [Mollisia scopiformis]KUJ17720.1 HET-domain-containing protein [Mollisia scopiformis]